MECIVQNLKIKEAASQGLARGPSGSHAGASGEEEKESDFVQPL